jgi:S1-C subfamily serine protease
MKKLLGIMVLGLLLSGNAYANKIPNLSNSEWQITKSKGWKKNKFTFYSGGNCEWQFKDIFGWRKDYDCKWSQDKRTVKIEINERWLVFSGNVNGNSMNGNAVSRDGYTVPFSGVAINVVSYLRDKEPKKEKPKIITSPDDNKVVPAGSGSGFIVSNEGHIITNHHVIEGCNITKVSFKGNQLEAKVLAVDKMNDIAILKSNIKPENIFSVSNEDVSLLEDVVVAGYPLGKQVSSAIKTHKGVVTALAGAGDNYSNFQTDASINAGNSGGPIMNQKGNIVGVAVATWVEEGVQGVHFGIKSSTLKTFANSNSLTFTQPNNSDLSNKDLGKLITEATVYLECHMTVANIKKMMAAANNRKAFFSEFK